MKTSTTKHIFLTLFLITGCFSLQAQQENGKIQVHPKTLERKGANLEIDMAFDMSNLLIHKVESRIYTPILISEKYNKELELPKIIIKGKRRYKADLRKETLSRHTDYMIPDDKYTTASAVYAIEKFNKNNYIRYRTSVAYNEWMEDAIFNLREDVYGCCGIFLKTIMHRDIFREAKAQQDIYPKFRYITPEKELEKRRYEIGKAYLDFPQGKSLIDPYFRNNRHELDKINHMLVMLASDPDVSIQSIEMRGYASPESSQSYNYTLSSRRAQAMRDYFAHLSTRIPASLYQVGVGGEDWEGLKNLLTDYPVSHRHEILDIINTVQEWDTREQMIKNVGGGGPYQLIFRDLYPQLRRVDCQINYIVRNFTLDEGKERIRKNPKMLSQNEMYEVARSYPEGSDDFNQTLITAQQHYPSNDAANLNAASVALSNNDSELAEAYLSQVKNTNSPEYINCMGVLSTLKGDYNVAEVYLKRAQAAGVAEATHNLQELKRLRSKGSMRSSEQRATPSSSSDYKSNSSSDRRRIMIDGEVYIKENE